MAYLEKKATIEGQYKEEEMNIRKAEIELEHQKLAMERERFELDRREREARIKRENDMMQIILANANK